MYLVVVSCPLVPIVTSPLASYWQSKDMFQYYVAAQRHTWHTWHPSVLSVTHGGSAGGGVSLLLVCACHSQRPSSLCRAFLLHLFTQALMLGTCVVTASLPVRMMSHWCCQFADYGQRVHTKARQFKCPT